MLEACERMAHGQILDLFYDHATTNGALDAIVAVHAGKTGALISAAAVAGAVCGRRNGNKNDVQRAQEYGDALGVAFQIMDDTLDATQTVSTTGKTSGRDKADGKPSYVAAAGLKQSVAEVERLATTATESTTSQRLARIAATVSHAARTAAA